MACFRAILPSPFTSAMFELILNLPERHSDPYKKSKSFRFIKLHQILFLSISSVSQTGFRGTLGFHRTPFGIPIEIIEYITIFKKPQKIITILRSIARILSGNWKYWSNLRALENVPLNFFFFFSFSGRGSSEY